MKNYWFIFLAFVLFGCGEATEETVEDEVVEDNVSINGVVTGAPNTTFFLEAKTETGTTLIAEATSDKDGKFELIGTVEELGLFQLRKGNDQSQSIILSIVPGDQLAIKTTSEDFVSKPNASGTSWAKTMNLFMAEVSEFRAAYSEIQLSSMDNIDEVQEKYAELKKKVDDFAKAEMAKDPSNPFNIILTTYAVPPNSFEGWDESNLKLLKKVSEAFIKKYPDAEVTAMMGEQVWDIERAYNDYMMNSSGTRPAPEIALKNPEGQEIRLSSLRGKYVLIDFWASWCGPCRRESPNVVRLYNKYKDKGFTVYSVSLDSDAAKWKQAIEDDGLVWPNHVSDLLQWNSPMTQLYGISSIPHTVLVNDEGMIIGTGLRGPALEQKLEDIFENNTL